MSDYPTITLQELFTPEQLSEITLIVFSAPTYGDMVVQLKAYCQKHGASLEARGMVPDYVAWMIVAGVSAAETTPADPSRN